MAYRSSATHNELDPTTSCTVTIPADATTDDYATLIAVNRNGTADLSVTDNDTGGNTWTLIHKQVVDTTRSFQLWGKRITSGSASKTVTVSGATNSVSAGLALFSGRDTGATPWEAVSGEANVSGNETHAEITVSSGSDLIACIGNCLNDLTPTTQSFATAGAATERFNKLSAGGSDCGVNLSSINNVAAGATGAFTWAQTNNITGSILFALKVAAAAKSPVFQRRDHPALLSQIRR